MEFWWTSSLVLDNRELLAIDQTNRTVCCKDDYFPKGKFRLFNSLFHSVYFVFPKSLFSIADLFAVRYLWVVMLCCDTVRRRHSLPWLVYVDCSRLHVLRAYCNFELKQANNAQIIINSYSDWSSILTVCCKGYEWEITLATKGREDCDPFSCHLSSLFFSLSRWKGQCSPCKCQN